MGRWLLIVAVLAGGAYWFNVGNIRQQLEPKLNRMQGKPPATQSTEVVRWRDRNGTWVYGDASQAPEGVKVEKVALKPLTVVPSRSASSDAAKPDTPPNQPPKSALERMEQSVSSH